jgi:serine/threonine-protein kinase RsbT
VSDEAGALSMRVVSLEDRLGCAAAARAFGERAGLSGRSCAELAVVVAELASNAVRHAGAGEVILRCLADRRGAVEIVVRDRGPGIADPEAAMADGFSAATRPGARRGLGTGLGAARRLASRLSIKTAAGEGTTITVAKWDGG